MNKIDTSRPIILSYQGLIIVLSWITKSGVRSPDSISEMICLWFFLGDGESYLPIGGKTELKYSKSSLQYGHSYVPLESLPRSTVLAHKGHSTSTILCSNIIWSITLEPTIPKPLRYPRVRRLSPRYPAMTCLYRGYLEGAWR